MHLGLAGIALTFRLPSRLEQNKDMRILGNIDHPIYKITVLKTDQRLLLKIENQSYEQTFKLRIGDGIEGMADAKRFLNASFLDAVDEAFQKMHHSYLKNLKAIRPLEEESFDDII